jgi:isopentenyl diphosphate isomerase/L-lactate dehydrogenase-like FMN-dependent dehydrogenase
MIAPGPVPDPFKVKIPGSASATVPEAVEKGSKAVMATDWRALEALRPTTKLPLIFKGVLSPEDATQAA